MAEDEDLICGQHLIAPLYHSSSMVVIRESPIFVKENRLLFPPINHENLQLTSSTNTYLESPSESSSPSSSLRRSGSSSSFSLSPSDSDIQPSLTACEFDRKSTSETVGKSPTLLDGSTAINSDEQPTSTTCKSHQRSLSEPPYDLKGNSLRKPFCLEADVLQDWWEILFVRVYSKLKNLLTWFATTIQSYYPVLAIAIWWWMRVRARRKRVKGETLNHLRDVINERDERIVQLLHQIAEMNELLVNHHKDMVSRRG